MLSAYNIAQKVAKQVTKDNSLPSGKALIQKYHDNWIVVCEEAEFEWTYEFALNSDIPEFIVMEPVNSYTMGVYDLGR